MAKQAAQDGDTELKELQEGDGGYGVGAWRGGGSAGGAKQAVQDSDTQLKELQEEDCGYGGVWVRGAKPAVQYSDTELKELHLGRGGGDGGGGGTEGRRAKQAFKTVILVWLCCLMSSDVG